MYFTSVYYINQQQQQQHITSTITQTALFHLFFALLFGGDLPLIQVRVHKKCFYRRLTAATAAARGQMEHKSKWQVSITSSKGCGTKREANESHQGNALLQARVKRGRRVSSRSSLVLLQGEWTQSIVVSTTLQSNTPLSANILLVHAATRAPDFRLCLSHTNLQFADVLSLSP